MSKAQYSPFLRDHEAPLRALVSRLAPSFTFVSVLACDTHGISFHVRDDVKMIQPTNTAERGAVLRLIRNERIFEHSFTAFDDLEGVAEDALAAVAAAEARAEARHIDSYPTPFVPEEAASQRFASDVDVPVDAIDPQAVLDTLNGIVKDIHGRDERMISGMASLILTHVNKLYVSERRTLSQSYHYAEGWVAGVAKDGDVVRDSYEAVSCLGGAELLAKMPPLVDKVVTDALALLSARPVTPGEYDIITSPEVTGLIAHEAFGHGVEMDMFVKHRAYGARCLNTRVASDLVTMHEGARAAQDTASFAFDDEGVLAGDVIEIDHGILKTGVADTLAARRLGIEPTGNGRRESFERKAYTRMTNTVFEGGHDTLDAMIASIQHGYWLEGVQSGMEDPKNWGIQCIVRCGREIKDGRLTGVIVAPVILTGYVPDLLQSISMATPTVETIGCGLCGKGHKEWVKVSDGGPYLKARGRLG